MDNKKKTLMLVMGLVSGMVLVYGLDVLTTKYPATLRHDFQPWRILHYRLEARIDNLTVLEKDGRKVPARYRYTEEMDLRCYYYHAPDNWQQVVMMELAPRKIVPESITVDGSDATAQIGPGYARRVPPAWYLFYDFSKKGEVFGQRRAVAIRDMIVSTYYVRRLPKGITYTSNTWSGSLDMGPFITSYEWCFDDLRIVSKDESLADISGSGEFFVELPGGDRGRKLGSYTYSYTLGIGNARGYIREASGSFDLRSGEGGTGTSYREEFTQKLVSVEEIEPGLQRRASEQFAALRKVVELKELGDARAFHDGLVTWLRRFPDSTLWDKLFVLLNSLRTSCGEEPFEKEDFLGSPRERPRKNK